MNQLVERVDEQDDVLGVADRAEAARRGWLHRVATSICRDEEGRILVFRRSDRAARFPGYYDVTVGGAVTPGESYEQAAARGLAEQLGARVPVRPVVRFLCRGVSGSYWLGVHEAVLAGEPRPDPERVPWHGWMSEDELRLAVWRWPFTPDGQDAFTRYLALARR
ncbi:NUDIX hydrolase [Nonomuraea harbinensis]|uniref:NUDIX hydrolase n=1 Tax=Nonomuraea harbinensis TaxID=1286938 RepID=A0ABW1C783_9ACTN|nr:NUDIX domain-containing protein [Nonomuraea harbinensis]